MLLHFVLFFLPVSCLLLLLPDFPKRDEQAVVRDNLQALLPELEGRKQYKWIGQRVRSMEAIWVEAGRSLSEKYSLTQRRAKQVEHRSADRPHRHLLN